MSLTYIVASYVVMFLLICILYHEINVPNDVERGIMKGVVGLTFLFSPFMLPLYLVVVTGTGIVWGVFYLAKRINKSIGKIHITFNKEE